MRLSAQEIERFYSIWFPLLHYINQHKQVVGFFPSKWTDAAVDTEDALLIRDVLWEEDRLRDAFITENPAGLNADDLALVDSWQHRVAGDFFIFRHLKKHSVFIANEQGYAVHGITSSMAETVGPQLPIYVQAVLLPFEGRIIYDSLIASYPIYFGGGIRGSLEIAYRNVQERGGLITVLPPETTMSLERVQSSNKRVLLAFQRYLGKAGLSLNKTQEHIETITTFTQGFLQTQPTPRLLVDLTSQDMDTYFAQHKKTNRVSFKRFVRFLKDTERTDWDEAEELLRHLQTVKG